MSTNAADWRRECRDLLAIVDAVLTPVERRAAIQRLNERLDLAEAAMAREARLREAARGYIYAFDHWGQLPPESVHDARQLIREALADAPPKPALPGGDAELRDALALVAEHVSYIPETMPDVAKALCALADAVKLLAARQGSQA